MYAKAIAQCGSKNLVLIDVIKIGEDQWCSVYLLPDKRNVKRYCKQTGLSFSEGLSRLYETEKFK